MYVLYECVCIDCIYMLEEYLYIKNKKKDSDILIILYFLIRFLCHNYKSLTIDNSNLKCRALLG